MAAPTTTSELVELIRKSKLIEPAKLDAYMLMNPGPFHTPSELSSRLRADGLITSFHADQLIRGKYKGFFLGKYKVLDRIGLGGMGQVFLAEHLGLRRRVAIKVPPPDRAANEFSRERFFREARAQAQLNHPNLVRAFDVDQDGDVIFLVMEFVDGVCFHDLVSRFGALTPARAGYYLWQAASGLAYMHECGLIHRDIKPANMLVDRQGVVKILDLGLVRAEGDDDNLTRGEGVKILGTADYLAPEQAIDCSHVDIRADIYSLGATGYFLLTGKPPFEGDRIAQKLIAHQTKIARPIHDIRPEVSEELSAMIAKMMEKKPENRFQSPAEIVAALAEWARTPPPPPTEQEIPTAVGGSFAYPGTVNLSTNSNRIGRSSTHASSTTNGSAIRYYSDSQLHVNSGPLSGNIPPPAFQVQTVSEAKSPTTLQKEIVPLQTEPAQHEVNITRNTGRLRQKLSLALAFSLTLAVACWDVAILTGAVNREPSASHQRALQESEFKR